MENLPPKGSEVVLFHVINKIPEAFWDWEKDPLWPQRVEFLKEWESSQERKIRDFMERLRQRFLDRGFAPEAVLPVIRERQTGIARDLAMEAERGYAAMALGRRGWSGLDDLILGSVATKILNTLTGTPLWLIGGKPKAGKFLLALDASEGSMRAVEHLGQILAGTRHQIRLLHVVRTIDLGEGQPMERKLTRRFEEEAMMAIQPVFAEATQRLLAAGIDGAQITSKVMSGIRSRAAAILSEANEGGYGTITVGRRGLSSVEEYNLGQVTYKLTQLAKDVALWIVA